MNLPHVMYMKGVGDGLEFTSFYFYFIPFCIIFNIFLAGWVTLCYGLDQ